MVSDIQPGRSYPLGATVFPDGVNFSVFSKNCHSIDLLLFDDADAVAPFRVIHLDPVLNKTFYYWHVFVKGIGSGQIYGYRAYGPYSPADGERYDGWKVLLDPYSREVAVGKNYDRHAAIRPGDNCAHAMKSVVVDCKTYDWEGDEPLRHQFSKTVIYEMHVGGFTRHPNSGISAEKRGTYAGLIEKIPYLQELGVTAVELLPIQQFDEQDAPSPHRNYWGYSPICFFAPHAGYSSRRHPLGPVDEFRDMVKALHRAGIEVILDVVFNHSAEGNENGPTFCFRGLENKAYYLLEKDRSKYANFSGCGNTIKANHSIVRRMILDSLRYWASVMHVDGFRFDLASVMARGEEGEPLANPPILWSIESDPILAGTKIIAEAWDAAGLYQVGSFVGHRWAEWNGRFRDDTRQFMKGDLDNVKRISDRICASPDLYEQPEREPNRSINFITSHDGFTLNDLVSYNEKHNEDNGEENRDGSDYNFSWNCGVEGSTDNPEIEALRLRQIKNFLTILMVSQGTPMLLMGDEIRRTQLGNNNAYCQDNELSWFDWSAIEKQGDLLNFVKQLIHFNLTREIFQDARFW
ncbi:MAG: glycogen debranching protein GlgX, partial [Desulfobulbaceae bacterium]|nr:glycogen debranching protein GlgX [Desulfobulbaceae bacterium]